MKTSSLVIKDLQPLSWGKLQTLSADELSGIKGGLKLTLPLPFPQPAPIGCIGIWMTF